ncbi:MAG: molybdopterin oxidoreductase family protein [Veillonellaceae bacterium]|nr:molybdopterin oxidoreductase family protein [Veillonellaceae bacterium]
MTTTVKRSVCPFDCPDACGLLLEVTGDRVTGVRGDPAHSYTRGVLCPKMVHYERTIHSPLRLLTPLLRTGPKGSGDFRPISWAVAVEIIAQRWREILARYGGEAILPASYAGTMGLLQRNAGDALFHKLGASRLERTLCSAAKGNGWEAVMGKTLQAHPDEAAQSDLILIWGAHTLATNIHFLHPVREAKQRGAKVWVIETHETATVQTVADKVLLVRPGTDGALALGLMHILVRDNLVDRQFLQAHTQGFDQLETKVLPRYTPAKVAAITGVPMESLTELAHAYGKARAPFIRQGSGLYRYGNGAMTARLITSLPALVGAMSRPGGGTLGDLSTGSAFDMTIISRPDFLTKSTRWVNINQLGDALTTLIEPPIMSLYVYQSNPASVYPDQNRILQGLAREDLFTVVHERFMTDTAKYADIVLPATSSAEHADAYRSYGHYGVQRVKSCIPPLGEAKSNWDTFRLLARTMGFTEAYFGQTEEQVLDELFAKPGPWLTGVDSTRLNAGEPVSLPLPENYKMTFRTSSGKIEIANPAEPTPVPDWFPPYGGAGSFYLVTAPSLYTLNSSFNEQPELVAKKGPMSVRINPADANRRKLRDQQRVIVSNERGEVAFFLKITDTVPPGVLVADGVSWLQDAPGPRTINALTSQRLTDRAHGSTFYDVKVDIRPE